MTTAASADAAPRRRKRQQGHQLTEGEVVALDIAGQLIDAGIPVFAARPATGDDGEWDMAGGTGRTGYHFPNGWQTTTPSRDWLDPTAKGFKDKAWRPGWALGAVMGHGLDLLDIDPRNGGDRTRAALCVEGSWPRTYGAATTPSGGTHDFVRGLGVGSRDSVRPGLDIKAGLHDGSGRGFAFIAPTLRASKATGQPAPYVWTTPPDLAALARSGSSDDSGQAMAELVRLARHGKSLAGEHRLTRPAVTSDAAWSHSGPILEGDRHPALLSYAGSLRRRWLRLEEAEQLMSSRWAECQQPPFAGTEMPWDEALALLHDVYQRYAPGPPAGEGATVPEEGAKGAARDRPASWAPVDLSAVLDGSWTAPEPTLFARTDGQALLYPGLVHSFHGESESGKSLLLQIEAAKLVGAGEDVLFLDFESDQGSVVDRLLTFGASAEAIREHFTYVRPDADPRAFAHEAQRFDELLGRSYALAVIDGVTDALSVFGYETKDNDGITQWMRAVPKAIADRTGAATVLIDHVTKDSGGRGRFAIGGQAKMASLTGAAYVVEVVEPLGRQLRGVISLRIGKDRPGTIRQACGDYRKTDRTQEAARVVIDSRQPDQPTVTVESWDEGGSAVPFRPTVLMERVSRVVEAEAGLSKNLVAQRVGGNKKASLKAIDTLVAENFLQVEEGRNNSRLHTVIRPYRELDDPQSDRYVQPDEDEDEEDYLRTTWPLDPVVSGSGPYTGEPGTTLSVVPEPPREPPETTGLTGRKRRSSAESA